MDAIQEINEWAHCTDEFLLTVIYNEYIMSHCDMDSVLQLYEEMARRNIFANHQEFKSAA